MEAGPEGPASIGNVPTMTSPALTADGKCLAFPRSSSAPPRLAILQNFFEELRAKVPVK